jgi:hypothetical protein
VLGTQRRSPGAANRAYAPDITIVEDAIGEARLLRRRKGGELAVAMGVEEGDADSEGEGRDDGDAAGRDAGDRARAVVPARRDLHTGGRGRCAGTHGPSRVG